MQVYIDKISRSVVYSPTPFTMAFDVPDNLTKSVKVQKGVKHKENELKQRLYKTQDTPFKETIDPITVIKYEEKEVTNHYIDINGIPHDDKVINKVPIEWLNNDPVIVPNMVDEVIRFLDSSSSFTIDDLITAKYRGILEKSSYEFIIASEFIEQNINVLDKDHSANIGIGFVQLLPKGQAKINEVELDAAANVFEVLSYEGSAAVEIYINDVKAQNNKVLLQSKTNKIIITFKNPTNRAIILNAYSIGY